MSNEEGLKLPIEIPWKLAATTQPLSAGEPDETTVSMFYYAPRDEELVSHYPDERLIYLKVSISVSPAAFPDDIPPAAALGEGVPCFHLRLDMKVQPQDETTDKIRPYFHAAAPLHREMLQTGIIGADEYEGEAEAQFVGKSGSQMNEAFRSHSTTNSASANASLTIPIPVVPVSLGGSVRTTSTSVSGDRSVAQFVDTTQRQASEERRELISHTTRVENILTLLSTKYLGTPHLSFAMSPRPLSLLTMDPSDPNLWFSQLLARRSGGIEGIQEFTMVLLVPRRKDFCVEARLRRVCVLDDPPGPLTFDEPFDFDKSQHVSRMLLYLKRSYPIGTPLDELDIDLTGALQPRPLEFIRPALEHWFIGPQIVLAGVISPKAGTRGEVRYDVVNYKHPLEVWREVLIDEYEREASRSPVERGVLLGEDRTLQTCFDFVEGASLKVSSSNASVSPLAIVDLNPSDIDLGGIVSTAGSVTSTVRERAYQTVTRWNLLDRRLATLLANRHQQQRPLQLDDSRLLGVVLRRWSKLTTTDPRNLGIEAVSGMLGIGDAQRKRLEEAGVTNLRGLATALLYSSGLDQHNQQIELAREALKAEGYEGPMPEPIAIRLAPADLDTLRQQVGVGLQTRFTPGKINES